MSYKTICCLCLTLLFFCGGCGFKEGVVQKEPASFLWFTGNTQNATVYIDNLEQFDLKGFSDSSKKNLYQISPGKHSIVVKKSGEVVVDRIILLGNGITKEIQIP